MPKPTSELRDQAEFERQFAAHRAAVVGMLRADFPGLSEPEELYQEAWAELLELEARGEHVRHRRALLKKIAWRRAVDQHRRMKAEPMDPRTEPLTAVPDDRPGPEEHAEIGLDAEALRFVVETLDPRQAAVIKLRFDVGLTAREIRQQLGVSPKRLEKIVTEAYKNVLLEVAPDDSGDTSWARRQRSLLLACEVGIASRAQRRRAERMLETDVACRAMLRQMRSTLHRVAALLPMPLLPEDDRPLRPLRGFVLRFQDLLAPTNDAAQTWVGRLGTPTADALDRAGAGGLIFGGGATAKIVAVCLAAGGTLTLCVDGVRHLGPTHHHHAKHAQRAQRHRAPDVQRAPVKTMKRVPVVARTTIAHPAAKPKPRRTHVDTTPVSSPSSKPAPSPAPAGSTEFGPGNIGSAPASRQPAAAPQNGGGEFTP